MMKMKKYLPIIILAGLLAVLLLVYGIMMSRDSGDGQYGSDDSTISLIDRAADEITELTYTYLDEEVSLVYDGGKWKYKSDDKFPLDQTYPAAMAAKICAVTAYRQVAQAPSAEYGLDDPAVSVTVTYSDGKTYEYVMSDENSYNRYIYLWNKDDGAVYTVLPSTMTTFQYTTDDLIVRDTVISDVDQEYINSFYLLALDGREVTMTDTAGKNGLYALLVKLKFEDCADYYADEAEMLEKYGISADASRLEISYSKAVSASTGSSDMRIDAEYAIRFGNVAVTTDEDGNEVKRIYYSPVGSTLVYLADYSIYEDIVKFIDFEAA